MKIAIANDHAGVRLKNKIIEELAKEDIEVVNLGSDTEESVDYPDYAHLMIEAIIEKRVSKGILICGTGIGMSIAANRSSEVRAALCCSEFMAERARTHNDANVLVLATKVNEEKELLAMVRKFLSAEFEGGRHKRRVDKIR